MLNPKANFVSISGASLNNATDGLNNAVQSTVDAIKATPGVLQNQITIVPLGTIFDGTNYICSACVTYSLSN